MKIPQLESNPLRILGVFANSTLRDIEQNKAKMRAFARVGQEVHNPLWLKGFCLLPPLPEIDEDLLEKTRRDISLRADREAYSRFWFEYDENFKDEDQKAIELLDQNRISEARDLWMKRTDNVACKNLILLGILQDKWHDIADNVQKYFEGDVPGFKSFMTQVVQYSDDANCSKSSMLLSFFKKDTWRPEFKQVLVNNHKRFIDRVIEGLKTSDTSDALIMQNELVLAVAAIVHLDALEALLGKYSIVYEYYQKELPKIMFMSLYKYALLAQTADAARWALARISRVWQYIPPYDKDYVNYLSMRTHLRKMAGLIEKTGSNLVEDMGCLVPAAAIFLFLFYIFGGKSGSYSPKYYQRDFMEHSYTMSKLHKQHYDINDYWDSRIHVDSVLKRSMQPDSLWNIMKTIKLPNE